MDLKTREDLIKSVLLAEKEWELPYRLYLIQQIVKNTDTFKTVKLDVECNDPLHVTYEAKEILTRNRIHSNHWEIYQKTKNTEKKIATAYYEKNANLIVNALNLKDLEIENAS